MTTAFKNPPVNEVIISTYFNPPLNDFRSEHIGLFWAKVKEDFPTVKQQIPVMLSPDIGPVPEEIFPMPRYWFVASDDTRFIQLQKNAFMLNWRRRDGNEYPRYHRSIKPAFDKYYGIFDTFIRAEVNSPNISIDACELSYVNTVEPCEFWQGPQDTPKVIPSFSTLHPRTGKNELMEFVCRYASNVASDIQLAISIRTGMLTQQPDVPALAFEIKASGRLGGVAKPASDDWFERAHDAIVKCFVDMTSPKIQKRYWIPLEETP